MASGAKRSRTENFAATFDSSSDARVDFFFHLTEDTNLQKTIELLSLSWTKDPLDTLKLVAFSRDCRHGKAMRRNYFICIHWLFCNHFQTLQENLSQLVQFGCWKDLCQFVMMILFDGHVPNYLQRDDGMRKGATISGPGKKSKKKNKKEQRIELKFYDDLVLKLLKQAKTQEQNKHTNLLMDKNEIKSLEKSIESMEVEASNTEKEPIKNKDKSLKKKLASIKMQQNRNLYAQMRYKNDSKYKMLYDRVVELIALQLKSDLNKIKTDKKSISLCAKWSPSNGRHFDKYTSLASAIASKLSQLLSRDDIASDVKSIERFYQVEVCAPLRQHLKIPEVYMSRNQWSNLDYSRVASKCMQKNKSAFINHDKERFEAYLDSKKTVSGATLKPVEMVERAFQLIYTTSAENALELKVLEKQWLSLCENIQMKGCCLCNSIAICDVSGSMAGIPMNAALGLTILTMYLSEPPWDSMCITFSEHPEFHHIDPDKSFTEKLRSLQGMSWGMTTNINAVFKLILDNAIMHQLTSDQMPKLLLVFTDMEFDAAFPDTSLTNFEAATKLFNDNGYKLPTVAFWNLRGNTSSTSTPVQCNEMGTLLLSGYSGQQLALILKNDDFSKLTPMGLMRSAIDSSLYDNLKVYD